jgi:chaperone required for assembly of F1-ATPase
MSTPAFPKRFYQDASLEPKEGGYALVLDGRLAHTPRRSPLILPHLALAQRLATEWNAQKEIIDPRLMPLTRLVNVALDAVANEMASVREEITKYAASDLIFYRANTPDELIKAQEKAFDPILHWAQQRYEIALNVTSSVTHIAQEPAFLDAITRDMAAIHAPLVLSGVHVMMTLTGSALMALAVMHRVVSVDSAWWAAHVDEFYQERMWGKDDEALARRAGRWIEFEAAAFIVDCLVNEVL